MLAEVVRFEGELQAYLAGLAPENLVERDRAVIVFRQAHALRKPMETWMAIRAMRAQMSPV